MVLLALAVLMAVLDITRSIAASSLVTTSLLETWSAINANSLEGARQAVEDWMPVLWDPLLLALLKMPSWLVLGALSIVLFWLGQRRATKLGRFASQ